MLTRLVKQRKHYLSLTRKRILSKKGRPEIFAKNGRFPAKTGGLESLRISKAYKRLSFGVRICKFVTHSDVN